MPSSFSVALRVVMCVASVLAGTWVQPPAGLTGDSSQYYFSSSVVSGAAAEQLCRSYTTAEATSHLASIHSPAESTFIFQTWQSLKPVPRVNLWIGGARSSSSQSIMDWSWTDGTPFNVATAFNGCVPGTNCFWNRWNSLKQNNKRSKEPNNIKGNEYCLAINNAKQSSNGGSVRDDACSINNYYVCKKTPVPTTTTTTTPASTTSTTTTTICTAATQLSSPRWTVAQYYQPTRYDYDLPTDILYMQGTLETCKAACLSYQGACLGFSWPSGSDPCSPMSRCWLKQQMPSPIDAKFYGGAGYVTYFPPTVTSFPPGIGDAVALET